MKAVNKMKVLMSVIVLTLAVFFSGVLAQTNIEIYDQLDNSIIVKFRNDHNGNKLDKIILVFSDDNFTDEGSDELTSETRIPDWKTDTETTLTRSDIEAALEVDAENEMEIEDWMLKPFNTEYAYDFLVPVEEEDIELEDWMLDVSKWN